MVNEICRKNILRDNERKTDGRDDKGDAEDHNLTLGPDIILRRGSVDSVNTLDSNPTTAGSLSVRVHRTHLVCKGPIINRRFPSAPESNRINIPGDSVTHQCGSVGDSLSDEERADDLLFAQSDNKAPRLRWVCFFFKKKKKTVRT